MIELVAVIALVATLLAIAVLGMAPLMDRVSVSQSRSRLVAFYARSRLDAMRMGSVLTVRLNSDSLVTRTRGGLLVARTAGPAKYGVTLVATRDTIRLSGNGLGYGASNSTIVLSRGSAADTVVISRLGRLRH